MCFEVSAPPALGGGGLRNFPETPRSRFREPSWVILSHLWAILAPSYVILVYLGPSWGHVEASCEHLGPIEAAKMAEDGPRQPKICPRKPKTGIRGLKTGPRQPNIAQRRSKTAQERLKDSPKEAQDNPREPRNQLF